MTALITGGAGYIGSVTNAYLRKHGYDTVVFDNLSAGHRSAVGDTPLVTGDITRLEDIVRVFDTHTIDAVIHFAARALAGESMEKPYEYYQTNVYGGLNLLEAMRQHSCKTIVFSSTCAVYGYPDELPVTEDSPKNPVSVYGHSKLMFEQILHRYEEQFGIKSAVLRYFNAAGAMPDGSLGEDHTPESHIIPNAIKTLTGQASSFALYGTDYDTPDGTCIRDYVHVLDLADAHLRALDVLTKGGESFACNLGSGRGWSNREILQEIQRVSGKPIPVVEKPRRPGDPDKIYANHTKATHILGWEPKHSGLDEIIATAWKWHSTHPLEHNTTRSGSSK